MATRQGRSLASQATEGFFHPERKQPDYLHVFDYHGRRVTRHDLGSEAWQDWQVELAKKLDVTIAFFYGNFVSGVLRAVVDGIEPAERASESIQFELFEYVYHQICARSPNGSPATCSGNTIGPTPSRSSKRPTIRARWPACCFTPRPRRCWKNSFVRKLDEGDLLSNANTLVYLGPRRSGNKLGRAFYVAKHRGSTCTEEIVQYTIDDRGLRIRLVRRLGSSVAVTGDHLGLGHGVLGLGNFARPLVGHAQGRKAEGIGRLQLADLHGVLDRLVMATQPSVNHRQGRMGQRVVGLARQQLVQLGRRPFQIARILELFGFVVHFYAIRHGGLRRVLWFIQRVKAFQFTKVWPQGRGERSSSGGEVFVFGKTGRGRSAADYVRIAIAAGIGVMRFRSATSRARPGRAMICS